jgi:DNA-binding NtrC family response regulator
MHEPIMVVNTSAEECRELCSMLERNHYPTIPLHSLTDLESRIQGRGRQKVVILDLDSLPVDNRFIKGLCLRNPQICLIVLSSRTFHPELQEAMSTHISACLVKPLDADELIYWLRSVGKKSVNG